MLVRQRSVCSCNRHSLLDLATQQAFAEQTRQPIFIRVRTSRRPFPSRSRIGVKAPRSTNSFRLFKYLVGGACDTSLVGRSATRRTAVAKSPLPEGSEVNAGFNEEGRDRSQTQRARRRYRRASSKGVSNVFVWGSCPPQSAALLRARLPHTGILHAKDLQNIQPLRHRPSGNLAVASRNLRRRGRGRTVDLCAPKKNWKNTTHNAQRLFHALKQLIRPALAVKCCTIEFNKSISIDVLTFSPPARGETKGRRRARLE